MRVFGLCLFVDLDDCVSQPCLNGGECIDGVNSYSCRCTPQWQGPICQFGEITKERSFTHRSVDNCVIKCEGKIDHP